MARYTGTKNLHLADLDLHAERDEAGGYVIEVDDKKVAKANDALVAEGFTRDDKPAEGDQPSES